VDRHVQAASAVAARYRSETIAAMYLRAEWGDLLVPHSCPTPDVPPGRFYTDCAAHVAGWLAHADRAPVSWCDVGGATGRFLYEVLVRLESVGAATLLEPSEVLSTWARRLLTREWDADPGPATGAHSPPLQRGTPSEPAPGAASAGTATSGAPASTVAVPMPGSVLRPRTVQVPLTRWPEPSAGVTVVTDEVDVLVERGSAFDAVSCLNVLDRVPDPRGLLATLERVVSRDGVLVLSCPFDFTETFTPRAEWFADLRDIVDPTRWDVIGSADLPYVFRQYDRRVNSYLTQVVALTRRAAVSDRRE
jgi:SAM-dependent methyltransferase